MAKIASSGSTIQPLHDYVLIRPLEEENKTASGIIIPDTAKQKSQAGEVMAVGPGAYDRQGTKLMPMAVKVGQKVIYKKWGGEEVKVGNEEWTLTKDSDILAIVQ
jgi:chaperonin GroES